MRTLNIKCEGSLEDNIPVIIGNKNTAFHIQGCDPGRIGALYRLNTTYGQATAGYGDGKTGWTNYTSAQIGGWPQSPLLTTDPHVDQWVVDDKVAGEMTDVAYTYASRSNAVLNLNFMSIASENKWKIDNENLMRADYSAHQVPITLGVYLPEQYKLQEIKSAPFMYNGKHLQLNSGLPLISYLSEKGTVQIEFDYEISRSWGATTSELFGINVDVKKTNFLSGTNDYLSGTINSATSGVTLQNATVDTTTKHALIEVADTTLKEGDEMWMRIKPRSNAPGMKAQIKNLNVKLIVE